VSGYQVVATGNWLALLEEKFIPAVGKDPLRSLISPDRALGCCLSGPEVYDSVYCEKKSYLPLFCLSIVSHNLNIVNNFRRGDECICLDARYI
jgi:hypothetical protein